MQGNIQKMLFKQAVQFDQEAYFYQEEQAQEKKIIDRKYQYPANYKQARVHVRAAKFGYNNPKTKGQIKQNGFKEEDYLTPFCPCCQNLVNTIQIPLCYDPQPKAAKVGETIFLLPSGVALYFGIIKMIIVYLLLRFLLMDIVVLFFAMGGKFCQMFPVDCTYNAGKLSGYNLKTSGDQYKTLVLDLLSLLFTIISIIFFIFYKRKQNKLYLMLDYSNVTQDDFSVLIQNIPLTAFEKQQDKRVGIKNVVESKIKQWMQSLDQRDEAELNYYEHSLKKLKRTSNFKANPIITTITLCYDLTEIQNMEKLRQSIVNKHIQYIDNGTYQQKGLLPQKTLAQLKRINQQLFTISNKYGLDKSQSFYLSHFTGRAFITFQYEHYQKYLLDKIQEDKNFLQINKQAIAIWQAAAPTDIYWQNMNVSDVERMKSIVNSYIVLIMSLCFSLAILVILQLWQQKLMKSIKESVGMKKLILSNIITTIMSIFSIGINYILAYAIQKLTNFQRHQTKTDRMASLIIKTTISQFINTSIIYYIIYKFFDNVSPLTNQGIFPKIFSLVGVSAFINIGKQVVQPGALFGRIKAWWKYERQSQRDKQINLFQYQLNQTFQHPQFNFAGQYSYYIMMIYIVAFFSLLTPAASILVCVVFFIQYWVDKFNLFKRFSYSFQIGYFLTKLVFKSFGLSVLIFAVGHFLWQQQTICQKGCAQQIGQQVIRIINIVISFIFSIIIVYQPSKIENILIKSQNQLYEQPYENYLQKGIFKKTYWKQNPGTGYVAEKDIAVKTKSERYLSERQQRQIIVPEDFDYYVNYEDLQQTDLYEKYEANDLEIIYSKKNLDEIIQGNSLFDSQ